VAAVGGWGSDGDLSSAVLLPGRGGGKPFLLRVQWVAVPKALRARRANRLAQPTAAAHAEARLPRECGCGW
jgi:hypothetical protein